MKKKRFFFSLPVVQFDQKFLSRIEVRIDTPAKSKNYFEILYIIKAQDRTKYKVVTSEFTVFKTSNS